MCVGRQARHAWGKLTGRMARPVLDTDDATRRRMSRQRRRDTEPERLLRSLLHRMGLRFRVHRRPVPGLRREADLVFGPARVAVFVDGCFWHRCPDHGTFPRANGSWWDAKLAANVARDLDTDRKLAAAGWTVVRVWEHETPAEAATRVADVVRRRRPSSPSRP
jgi:DNA mismatch endonuclease (patch repair protein)